MSSGTLRLPAALATSALLHGLVLAMLLARPVAPPPETPALAIIPISLVSKPGGGGGRAGAPAPGPPGPPAAVASATPPAPEPPRAVEAPRPKPAPEAKPKPKPAASKPLPTAPSPSAPAVAATPPTGDAGSAGENTVVAGGGGGGGGDASGHGGGGDGSGGDGSGGARVAYGQNPRPPYPVVARRMGFEGVVLLDILVAPDGRATDVRIAQSSGHEVLDQSAVGTVRERWRFVPARRGGTPIESRVTVPIRFRLAEG